MVAPPMEREGPMLDPRLSSVDPRLKKGSGDATETSVPELDARMSRLTVLTPKDQILVGRSLLLRVSLRDSFGNVPINQSLATLALAVVNGSQSLARVVGQAQDAAPEPEPEWAQETAEKDFELELLADGGPKDGGHLPLEVDAVEPPGEAPIPLSRVGLVSVRVELQPELVERLFECQPNPYLFVQFMDWL